MENQSGLLVIERILRDRDGLWQQIIEELGLHDRVRTPDDAADVVCQVFGVPRGAARLYVRSHPAWSAEATVRRPGRAEAFRSEGGGESCWSKRS